VRRLAEHRLRRDERRNLHPVLGSRFGHARSPPYSFGYQLLVRTSCSRTSRHMSTAEQHGSKDTEADPSVSRRSPGWWCVVQHCVELRRLRQRDRRGHRPLQQ
jgi:hypothetical protein